MLYIYIYIFLNRVLYYTRKRYEVCKENSPLASGYSTSKDKYGFWKMAMNVHTFLANSQHAQDIDHLVIHILYFWHIDFRDTARANRLMVKLSSDTS